jgi:large subunit ribosomal protein L5
MSTDTATPAARTQAPPPRLRQRYRTDVAPALREEFSHLNVMQVPGLARSS